MPTSPMIFRQEALEYRLSNPQRGRSGVVLPRWMSRPVTLALWLALMLTAVAGATACFASVPVSESGLALVASASGPNESAVVVVLFPADSADRLHAGQPARISPETGQPKIDGAISAVGRQPLDASAIEQLGLPRSVTALLGGPVVLVRVQMDPADAETLAPGIVAEARLPVGSRQAGSFLPFVGRFFGGDA